MREINDTFGKQIGIVTQISDDENISFIVNNDVICSIGCIIALEVDEDIFVLAEIYKIEVEYYLDNSKQYFISKAVDNVINKIGEPNNKPRYGQYITAKILGHYKFDIFFEEILSNINRYTPKVFQKVFLVDLKKVLCLYGLKPNNSSIVIKPLPKFVLGNLSFPTIGSKEDKYNLHFDVDIFKKHTLLTGVTGAGKSRLCTLIVKELAGCGTHVNILDPHNEYFDFLKSSSKYNLNLIDQSNITFSEKFITPNTLTKLLPKLSEQQETLIYELFNDISLKKITLQSLFENLVREMLLEAEKIYFKEWQRVNANLEKIRASAKNYVDYLDSLISYLKKENGYNRANKLDVFIAVASKLKELKTKNLISSIEPNWLKSSPNSIDIFNIDYSSNDYVRRFINSIIQFLLRKQERNEFRLLVIDEAHLLLKDGTDTNNLLKQLLREARKFNISVLFVTQNLSDISEDILNQFQNQFNFRQKDFNLTKYYPDQICNVGLYGSKLRFAMRVCDIEIAK